MSLTAPGIKGIFTDFLDATPNETVVLQAVSAPAWDRGDRNADQSGKISSAATRFHRSGMQEEKGTSELEGPENQFLANSTNYARE